MKYEYNHRSRNKKAKLLSEKEANPFDKTVDGQFMDGKTFRPLDNQRPVWANQPQKWNSVTVI